MSNLEQTFVIKIENTSNYGIIKDIIINYDIKTLLGEYILNYKLYKIRCWTETNQGISGIQITYKDRITSKEILTIDISPKEFSSEEEIILETNEMINKITLWKEEAFRGFEVTTNKNREKKFGWCGTGTKVDLDEFDNGNNCLVGFYLGYNKKESIINSMGFYYINKKTFYLLLNLGIFMLRIKSKKNEFRKKIEEKLTNLDHSDKALYKACCLPDNPFFSIFKYIFV